MRVYLLSKFFDDGKFGRHPASDKTANFSPDQPQYSIFLALRNLGHAVVPFFFAPWKSEWAPGGIAGRAYLKCRREWENQRRRREFWSKVMELSATGSPDVVIVAWDSSLVDFASLERLRKRTRCKVVFTYGLSIVEQGSARDRRLARIVDLNAVITEEQVKEFEACGCARTVALPVSACCRNLHGADPARLTRPLCDVGFIGSLGGRLYQNRLEVLTGLADFNLGIWSAVGVEELERTELKRFYRGAASRSECPRLYSQCKIVINIHGQHAHRMNSFGNFGIFEISASGAFQLADGCPAEWFSGAELVRYAGIADLRAKIAHFLAHEEQRETIARAARERALREHAYENRMQRLMDLLFDHQ